MIFAYLDEFGHVGPFFSRAHPQHNSSPVFGIAGILLPEDAVRPFAGFFLHRKNELLAGDIQKSGKPPYAWEKKGTNLFTANSIEKYPNIRQTAFRLINQIKTCRGKIFYSGRQKIKGQSEDLNSNGLYKTVLAQAIRQIDSYCQGIGENYVIVIDEHSARKELLDTAAKTMFGNSPARRLSSTPFEVESYLNQNIQAADWVAAIVGRMWNYRLEPAEFKNLEPYTRFFWDRIHSASTHSSVWERPAKRLSNANRVGSLGEVLLEAQALKATSTTLTVQTITFETTSLDNQ